MQLARSAVPTAAKAMGKTEAFDICGVHHFKQNEFIIKQIFFNKKYSYYFKLFI